MGKTKIEWSEQTWNPIVGCTHVSAGCDHCYAATLHNRRYIAWKRGRFPTAPAQYRQPFKRVQLLPERLNDPAHWRKPRRVFVNSVSDLFHEDVPDEFIMQVFTVMRQAKQHTFQVLTKRPERMKTLINRWYGPLGNDPTTAKTAPNVWLGTSVENQAAADERIPLLLETPAAVRFLSCEPLLELVNIEPYLGLEPIEPEYPWDATTYERVESSGIHWVIVGGESGPHARPMFKEWAYYLVTQCKAAGIPIFMKQLGTVWAKTNGAHDHHGGDMSEWPLQWPGLRVREYPVPQTAESEVASC